MLARAEQFPDRTKLLSLLSGRGIEIGALHRPVFAPHLAVQYVDRMSVEDLRRQYPELAECDLVEASILDDAETLATIPELSQDFVIANHVIEHMRDPIGAMLSWQRVLKKGGRLFLAAPDKNHTFDKQRDLTDYNHILLDHRSPSKERDNEAFLDFALNVSCRVFGVRPESEYQELAKELAEMDYSIHFHVWDYHSFGKFLEQVRADVPELKLEVVGELPTSGQEFIFVLERPS